MFGMFGISGMRFRLVNYLCEVSEKVRIFELGLDDIKIEHIKFDNFGEEYFADKSDKILLFKEIFDNDIVIIEKSNTAHNGDIVVAMNDDNEVTIKRFYKEKNHFRLQPENDYMEPIILDNVTILGKLIGLYRAF